LAFGPLGRGLLQQGQGRGHWSVGLLVIDQYRLYRVRERGLRGRFGLKLQPLLLLLLGFEAGIGLAGPFQRLSVGIGRTFNRLFWSLFRR
jgi:hypothetical protein